MKRLLIVFVFCLAVLGCSNEPEVVVKPRHGVDGLVVRGDTYETLVARIGEPTRTVEERGVFWNFHHYDDHGMVVVTSTSKRTAGKVVFLFAVDDRFATETGLRVGDPKSKIKSKGGSGWSDRGGLDGYSDGIPDSNQSASYFFKKDSGKDPDIALIRWDLR